MARIVFLEVENYRGIRELRLPIKQDLICLIGRGDSGKTTILDAIHAVLNPSWNPTFYDTDFHLCDLENEIRISATLTDIPEILLTESRYGLYAKGYDESDGSIHDDLEDHHKLAVTIVLTVDKSLEPSWMVSSGNEQGVTTISASDRARLNCFKIADYVDSHFLWSKGTPLYSLLQSFDDGDESVQEGLILDALRDAKKLIDQDDFENLDSTTDTIVKKAATLGLDISETSTTIDIRDLSVRNGRICLHDKDIPFRSKGKGSKRLASVAIQSALGHKGGVMLIDEIEQGLEPDRITNLVRILKDENEGQVFLTTHSRDAICELDSADLVLILKDKNKSRHEARRLDFDREKLRAAVRACPEAFFAKKIIVCEGKTEIGICRSMDADRYERGKPLMSFLGCAYVDGGGSELVNRAKEIREAGFDVAILCDSDVDEINSQKEGLVKKGITVIDCSDGYSIEKQVFKELPWIGINNIIDYIISEKYRTEKDLESALKDKCEEPLSAGWRGQGSNKIRKGLFNLACPLKKGVHKSAWFKRIDHGQRLGRIIIDCLDEMEESTHLKCMFEDLSEWIDG